MKRPVDNDDSVNKKQRKYRKDGSVVNFKTFSPPEGPGIFITCVRGKEKQALNDILDILNEICDRHFPDLKVQSKKAEVIKETDNKEETPEVAENDIKAQLAQELSEMNDKKKVDNSAKRFVNHQTNTQCLIYLEVRKPFDPIAIVKAYLNEVIETGKMRTKYIQRLTPISHLSHATEAAFEALCGMICQSHLSKGDEEGKGRKYRIELGKRSHNTLKRDDIIQTVVDSINSPHKIDLSNPDRWVIVEIFKGVAGVSVVSEYDKYRKFNPFSLIEAKNKGEDKRDEL
ncbi:hypothetical protein WALSEDRAFT_63917 [Wallemia mellicola CBS 633.66]|uniref:THUMP domain-containing protein n=1 Tax=Wallemia mellicola (strain ATCC MYA-4683 / CBS 633.66) TaxID=671144 RepID=I4YDY7_WALMC|nr:hypothetical protein WALSEDRAFT_63917 [Wallemia mellicola CBS 633.66]EIM22179.1 hypothetical protein WALSEDRAFT_63917 [Wallemia mellicola CBS 633.66]|eukprot:XP_006957976.1 hypothetical protein WALSEDRAFT_63917 [Wallemia mellicola CBS 633.66]